MEVSTERKGNTVIARISGRIEGRPAAEELEERLSGATRPGDRRLVLECRETAYVSGAGLRTLMVLMRRNEAAGIRMVACALPEPVRTVFEVSGMDRAIPVVDTLEEALRGEALEEEPE